MLSDCTLAKNELQKLGITLQHSHYNDVVIGAMASQITTLTIVYSTVYSGTDQRKYQSSASLAIGGGGGGGGITGDLWISRTKGQ